MQLVQSQISKYAYFDSCQKLCCELNTHETANRNSRTKTNHTSTATPLTVTHAIHTIDTNRAHTARARARAHTHTHTHTHTHAKQRSGNDGGPLAARGVGEQSEHFIFTLPSTTCHNVY